MFKGLKKGFVMALAALTIATATVPATATVAQAATKKTAKAPTKVKISKKSLTTYRGKTVKIVAKAYAGSKKTSTGFTWTTSDANVATVYAKGGTAKVKAVGQGTARITATSSNGISATCSVKVKKSKIKIAVADTSSNGNNTGVQAMFRKFGCEVHLVRSKSANPANYDGLVIPGGGDVNPRRYGEGNHGSNTISDSKDSLQIGLVKKFVDAGKPVFGICRGAQVINVALGGSLKQHIGYHHRGVRRTSKTVAGTPAASVYGGSIKTTHYHHQAVKKLGKDLKVMMKDSGDGTIEGIYTEDMKVMAVQWHPEIEGSNVRKIVQLWLQQCGK